MAQPWCHVRSPESQSDGVIEWVGCWNLQLNCRHPQDALGCNSRSIVAIQSAFSELTPCACHLVLRDSPSAHLRCSVEPPRNRQRKGRNDGACGWMVREWERPCRCRRRLRKRAAVTQGRQIRGKSRADTRGAAIGSGPESGIPKWWRDRMGQLLESTAGWSPSSRCPGGNSRSIVAIRSAFSELTPCACP